MTRQEILSFISGIDGWLSSHEGFFLYEASKKVGRKGVVVEIGSWLGKSTICLAAGALAGNNAKVYAIDPHKGEFTKNNGIGKKAPTYQTFMVNLRRARVVQAVKSRVTTSADAAKNWKLPIDLLFIDGLHDYKNTILDFSLWSPFLSNKGVVAFHDAFCGHEGPEKVVLQEILFNNKWNDIGVVGSIIFAKKSSSVSFWQSFNRYRMRIFIPLAMYFNKQNLPKKFKFFLIHRVIKLLLANHYTLSLNINSV